MTKHHFERLAKALEAARKDCVLNECPMTDSAFDIVVDQIALACTEFNPRFDYDRFWLAARKA